MGLVHSEPAMMFCACEVSRQIVETKRKYDSSRVIGLYFGTVCKIESESLYHMLQHCSAFSFLLLVPGLGEVDHVYNWAHLDSTTKWKNQHGIKMGPASHMGKDLLVRMLLLMKGSIDYRL